MLFISVVLILLFIFCVVMFKISKNMNYNEVGGQFQPPIDVRPATEEELVTYHHLCMRQEKGDSMWVSRGVLVDFEDNLGRGASIGSVSTQRDYSFLVDFHPEWNKMENEEKDLHWVSERNVYYKRTSRGYIWDGDLNEGIKKNTGCNILWKLKDGKYYFRYILPDGVSDGKRYINRY